ncbi:MAG TPA: helix-turn-helix domain-containing protein [Chloroflexota bacterium]|nr:helix-turn-helix domain-containing protein [Chloroflexota bacterium]
MTVPSPPAAENSLTTAEAAARLGVSERTLRERIKAGKVHAVKVIDGGNAVYRVFLDGPPPAETTSPPLTEALPPSAESIAPPAEESSPPVPEALLTALTELGELVRERDQRLDQLHRENVELAGRVGFYQGQVQQLQHQLGAAQERITLLEAPQPTEGPQSAPSGQSDGAAATTARESAGHENGQDRPSERRPWWRFWT